jgi:peptide/nickel transport system permease protein
MVEGKKINVQAYILRRLLYGLLTIFLVSLIIFSLLRIAPGDVALQVAMQGQDTANPELINPLILAGIREQLGLDHPLYMQYLLWSKGMLTGDWGSSFYTGNDVFEEFKHRAPVTLQLAIMAVTLSIILGIPAGIIMAIRQDTWIDYVVRVWSLLGLSVPNFWIATMVIMIGVFYFDWSPRIIHVTPFEDLRGNLAMFMWPVISTGAMSQAVKARMMRSTMLEVLRQDYIRTAHAKGLRYFVVINRHAIKNALLPVVTIIGIQVAFIASGSVIIETIFQLPGMGTLLIRAMNQRDYEVVQSLVTVITVWILLTNLAVDLFYGWLDPRVRFD